MRVHTRRAAVVVVVAAGTPFLPHTTAGDAQAPMSAGFTAVDFAFQADGGSGTAVTIAQGGSVAFAYPSGQSRHNVDFAGSREPASCRQTGGADSGPVPPLPRTVTGPGWSGTCTFTAPGTYAFFCDLHPQMSGTVTVVEPAPEPTPGPAPTATPTPGGPAPQAPAPRAARDLRVAAAVRAGRIRGSVVVARSGSALRVDVLGRVGRGHRTRAGTMTRTRVPAGRQPFAVRLSARASRVLARRERLAVAVRVRVRPPDGRVITLRATRKVR